MRKQIIFTALLAALLLMAWPGPSFAADPVQVTLPSFSVTLNGQTNGNQYSKYPLIVYKNITYFPMTYYDCRLLGLKTDWTAGTGLVIDKNEDYFYEYLREVTGSKNAKTQTAKLADGKITVNGKVIDNSKEEYPLLVFRDVTYFPLTWRFAVNEFGWDYRFNQQEGLVIHNDKMKLENPEKEKWDILPYAEGHCGRGDRVQFSLFAPFPHDYTSHVASSNLTISDFKSFIDPASLDQSSFRLELSNMGNVDKFLDARIEFCIYRQINTKEELVYRYLLSPLSERIEWAGHAYYDIDNTFWTQPIIPEGTYHICLQTPDYFDCYRFGEMTPSQLILHGSDSEVLFSGTEYLLTLSN